MRAYPAGSRSFDFFRIVYYYRTPTTLIFLIVSSSVQSARRIIVRSHPRLYTSGAQVDSSGRSGWREKKNGYPTLAVTCDHGKEIINNNYYKRDNSVVSPVLPKLCRQA